MDYCLPKGYRPRLEPEPFADEQPEFVWQPDVYPEAATLARRLGAERIVGLACGAGRELAALYPSFDIVGLDTPANIRRCRDRYAFGTWLELDVEADDEVDAQHLRRAVVVCKSVLERLVEPERLLNLISRCLDTGAAAVVLSTPDRALTSGTEDLGPPVDRANVREWTSAELQSFVASAGLSGHFGLTRSTELPPSMTSLFVAIPSRAPEYSDLVEAWWEERARWQRLAQELERTIAQQHAWIGDLRSTKDWLARERAAWEATSREKEAELAERDRHIANLEASLAPAADDGDQPDRRSPPWTVRLRRPLGRIARRDRPQRG
jgi:hypothetical protein